MLLIVAPNERKVRIEVGYGLEGTLTDAITRLIIENSILPRFRANDYPGGITRGVDDIIQVLTGDAEEWKQRAAKRPDTQSDWTIASCRLHRSCVILFGRDLDVHAMRPAARGAAHSGRGSGGPARYRRLGSSGRRARSGGRAGSDGGGFSGGGGSFGGGGSSGSW